VSREKVWGLLMVAPALLLLIVFYLLPILYSIRLGFYDVGFVKDTWLGAENYRGLLSEGGYGVALQATGKFLAVYLFSTMIMAYALALGLRRFSDRFRGTLLTIYYVPTIFSGIVTVTAWRWIFRYPEGGLNNLLGLLGISGMSWLGNPTTAPWVIGFIMLGMIAGNAVLLYVATIAGVNPEIIEAAQMDGAGEWQVIWHIITPLTHRVRLYLFLVTLIGALNIWEHPFFLTGGGPMGSTTTVMLKVYHKAFVEGDLGMASAMTGVTALSILALSVVIVRWLREFLG